MITRVAKAAMSLFLGLFALLVAVDNLIDYDTNYAFVQHVFRMDTTFPGGHLMWRAIRDPAWWTAGYLLIIAGEAVTALLFLTGSVHLLIALRGSAAQFEGAKGWLILGGLAGFGVWFVGFMLIGGEWFQMWQSPNWNGQQSAFRFYITILIAIIFINQPDREDTLSGPGRRSL